MHIRHVLRPAIPILALLTRFALSEASLADSELASNDTGVEKRCENPCGFYHQVCCEAGEKCVTNDNGQAVCSGGSGGGGGGGGGTWKVFTTTIVATETDLSTITSTWSSFVADETGSAGGSGKCDSELGESVCGNTCCGAAYVCHKDQCIVGSSSIWATATATPPVRGTSDSTVTQTATTTRGFDAPVGTDGAPLLGANAPSHGLSGGAIAGIVVGVIAGVFLLFLVCACLCCRGVIEALAACLGLGKRKRKDTYVDEHGHHHAHYAHGGRPEGRTWFGARPHAHDSGEKKSKWGGWATVGIILGALALCLGLKRRQHHDEKSTEYTYPSSYYTYSDYTSASMWCPFLWLIMNRVHPMLIVLIGSESSDRRTRDTRRSRRSRTRSRRS